MLEEIEEKDRFDPEIGEVVDTSKSQSKKEEPSKDRNKTRIGGKGREKKKATEVERTGEDIDREIEEFKLRLEKHAFNSRKVRSCSSTLTRSA